jgi:hypothetical protein
VPARWSGCSLSSTPRCALPAIWPWAGRSWTRPSSPRPAAQHEAERAALKAGEIPEGWAEKPAKLRQKDRDARWTVKFSKARPREDGAPQVDLAVPAFGYKNHVAIDRRHGLIRGWTGTHAAAHDGARLEEVLDGDNTASDVWADTAYRSAKNEAMLAARGLVSRIIARSPRAVRCRGGPGGPMPPSRRCAPGASTSLPIRRG